MPTISTAHYQRMTHAFVRVEHPDGWSAEEIRAALDAKALDIGQGLCFWANNDTETTLAEVYVGVDEPDVEDSTPIDLVPGAKPAGVESESESPMMED